MLCRDIYNLEETSTNHDSRLNVLVAQNANSKMRAKVMCIASCLKQSSGHLPEEGRAATVRRLLPVHLNSAQSSRGTMDPGSICGQIRGPHRHITIEVHQQAAQ
jgi:hypothetical protein